MFLQAGLVIRPPPRCGSIVGEGTEMGSLNEFE